MELQQLLHALSQGLAVSYAAASALVGINAAAAAVANLLAGLACDRWPRLARAVIPVGCMATVLFMSALGIAGSYWILLVLVIAGASGCGAFHQPAFAAAGEVLELEGRVS